MEKRAKKSLHGKKEQKMPLNCEKNSPPYGEKRSKIATTWRKSSKKAFNDEQWTSACPPTPFHFACIMYRSPLISLVKHR